MQNHDHIHPHKQRKNVVNRLARIEGHVRAIKEMAREGHDCPDILLQITAARKALDSTAKIVMKDHLETKTIEDLNKALDHYFR